MVSLTLGVAGILIEIAGFIKAVLADPTGIKYTGVFGIALGCSGAAAFYGALALA